MSITTRRLQRTQQTTSAIWPDATNTGYRGTLTNYSGGSSILVSTTLVNKRISTALQVFSGATLTLNNCWVDGGFIDGDYADQPITLTDCQIDAGEWQGAAVTGYNIHITRCNITGAQHSVLASDNVTVEDSWLHDQYGGPVGSSYHNNAFISNGGSNIMVRHNRLDCSVPLNGSGGGPTADASILVILLR
ncbi:hypothetical protein IPL85_02555 [Candidatus Saccharibacteria bacterium]|nr:MAG: hypothetical protein IPL85_02555 [Candidatus Saccharibacteria bacterium]